MKKITLWSFWVLIIFISVALGDDCGTCPNQVHWRLDGGETGLHVIIKDDGCGPYPVPASFRVVMDGEWEAFGCFDDCSTIQFLYLTFHFDPNVFSVSMWDDSIDDGESRWVCSLAPYSPIVTVSAKESVCDDKSSLAGKTVEISACQTISSEFWWDCVDCECYSGCYGFDVVDLGNYTVDIQCPTKGGSGPGGGGSGGGPGGGKKCKTCNSGGIPAGAESLTSSFQNTGIWVGQNQSDTLNFYGSVCSFATEINAEGYWIAADRTPGWSVEEPTFTPSGGPYTMVSFSVTDTTVYPFIKREYSLSGNWESKEQCMEETRGRIPLNDVKYIYDDPEDPILYAHYDYTSIDNGVKITNYNINGQPIGYVVYEGGIDSSRPAETLKCIWYGTNYNDYLQKSGEVFPGGRWKNISTKIQPQSGIVTIDGISSCGDCGGSRIIRDFCPASRNTKWTEEYLDYIPTSHLVSHTKDAQNQVLSSFNYDTKDRVAGKWLGNKQLKVFDRSYTDRELRYVSSSSTDMEEKGENSLIEKQYVSNTQFRAKQVFADHKGNPIREIVYHNLQTGIPCTGPYSEACYSYLKNEWTGITTKTIILPDKSKVEEYYTPLYDSSGYQKWLELTKRVRNGITEFERQYTVRSNKPVIEWSKNEHGAQTDYTYDSRGNTLTRTDPAPGVFGKTGRLVMTYAYTDPRNPDKVTLEYTSDGKAETHYTYDDFGNLKTKKSVQYNANHAETVVYLTTTYEYNEFNEQILSYDTANGENRNIHRTFYSNAGVVVGEATYLDKDDNSMAINATFYEYDNGRLMIKKTANMSGAFTFTVINGVPSSGVTWVQEYYQYDTYGRRTSVTADYGGKNLITSYEYNNQSEVFRVTTPDQHYTETVRDSRGLVREVINGIKTSTGFDPKATTFYDYDSNGNLIKKKDPTGVCENYHYDKMGRKDRTWKTKE